LDSGEYEDAALELAVLTDEIEEIDQSELRDSDSGIQRRDNGRPSRSVKDSGIVLPEDRLRDEERWEELIELYLKQLASGPEPAASAQILRRIAAVFLDELDDPEQAFDGLLEAFRLDPGDEAAVAPLEKLAREQGRWAEMVGMADAYVSTEGNAKREVRFCEHLVRWKRAEGATSDVLEPYLVSIRRLDPNHPLAARRIANPIFENQIEALQDAISLSSKEERAPLRMQLAQLYEEKIGDLAEAMRQYESAAFDDPDCFEALLGIERICRVQERFAELEHVLERQGETAITQNAKISALIKLAELHEHHFVRPQQSSSACSNDRARPQSHSTRKSMRSPS
jgi:tetratricopeptide (TPR) repeat protein